MNQYLSSEKEESIAKKIVDAVYNVHKNLGSGLVDEMNPVWEAQILSHLKLTNKHIGFLINFNVPIIKKGIKRFII